MVNVVMQDQGNVERRILNPKQVVPALLISSIQSTLVKDTSPVVSSPRKKAPHGDHSPEPMGQASNMRVVAEKVPMHVDTERAKYDSCEKAQEENENLEQVSQIKEHEEYE